VGVGYSYVEDESLLVTTDWQQAEDATVLIQALVKEVPALQAGPLFLVAESYGGRYAATIGASVARAVRAGELNVTLGGDSILFSSYPLRSIHGWMNHQSAPFLMIDR
jgi:serine carboxypeptidase 1